MSVVANVAVNVDATKAIGQLKALDGATGQLDGKLKGMSAGFGGLSTAIAGLGLSAFTQQIAAAGIDADRTSQRIKNLAGANGEAKQLFESAGRAAKQFGIGTTEAEQGLADLYGRLRPSGVALKDIETTFFGVNKAALAMGLTSGETSNVFLQLSQAMGSGKLQGDELRSIMEQLPAVGQAVAKVMGVTVGEVKKLGADGKITTEIMIKAAAELNKLKPPPPDAFKQFNAAMSDLRRELGDNILPIITPLVHGLLGLVKAFGALPEPVQTLIVGVGLIATALTAIGGAVAILAPAFTALGGILTGIGPVIAGWAGAVVPAIAAITAAFGGLIAWLTGTLVPALAGIFSGPIGWTVLALAAVVALCIAFREPIMGFLSWLGGALSEGLQAALRIAYQIWVQPWVNLWNLIKKPVTEFFNWIGGVVRWGLKAAYAIAYQIWVQPWVNLWNGLLKEPVTQFWSWLQGIWKGITSWFAQNVVTPLQDRWQKLTTFLSTAMQRVARLIPNLWTSAVNATKNAVNGILRAIGSNINSVIGLVNRLIAAFNQLPGPDIPLIGTVSVPQFAAGGIVDKPTLAMVGEGGEREYIVPESKMAQASANYLAGARGNQVMNGSAGGAAPTINITTGPVVEFDGKRFVSMEDLEQAMRVTAQGVIGQLRTPAARIALRGA